MQPRHGDRCAIVMGLDVSGYGIVRSLAREGVPVVGLWRHPDESARFSRHCLAVQVTPDTDDAWIAALLALAGRYDRPVLFPSNDRYAELLSRHRATLAPVSRFDWVDAAVIHTVLDKAQIGAVCARAGVPVPWTIQPDARDIAAQARDVTFPCLIKPRTTFRAGLPDASKVIVCDDAAALVAAYRATPALHDTTLWQEIITGGDDAIWQGTALARRSGGVTAIATVRKIRQYPPGYGITSFGRTAECPEVTAHTTRLLRALGWAGFASVEFKRSARDGRLYFIEMNPRLPWYNVLFDDAGINLAWLSWCALTGETPEAPRQLDGVGWVSLGSDLASFWSRSRAGTLGAASWLATLADAQSFSWYERADIEPAIHAALRLPGLAWRESGRRRAHAMHPERVQLLT